MAHTLVGIIDDGYPKHGAELLEREDIEGLFDLNWHELALKELNQKLLATSARWSHLITVRAFLHPEFFLKRPHEPWDALVYDWEYSLAVDSSAKLLELLKRTQARVYVFTNFDNDEKVERAISDPEFAPYIEDRIRVLHKTDEGPDTINTYVTARFMREEDVQWKGLQLRFEPSDYVLEPSMLWKLSDLLGDEHVLPALRAEGKVTGEIIKKLFAASEFAFFVDEKKRILSSAKSEKIENSVGPMQQKSILEALGYGIDSLIKAREKGYVMLD